MFNYSKDAQDPNCSGALIGGVLRYVYLSDDQKGLIKTNKV